MYESRLEAEKKGQFYFDRVEVGDSNSSTPTRVPRRSGTLSFSKSELLANFYSKCAGICIGNATA